MDVSTTSRQGLDSYSWVSVPRNIPVMASLGATFFLGRMIGSELVRGEMGHAKWRTQAYSSGELRGRRESVVTNGLNLQCRYGWLTREARV